MNLTDTIRSIQKKLGTMSESDMLAELRKRKDSDTAFFV